MQPVTRIHQLVNALSSSGCYSIFRNIAIMQKQMQAKFKTYATAWLCPITRTTRPALLCIIAVTIRNIITALRGHTKRNNHYSSDRAKKNTTPESNPYWTHTATCQTPTTRRWAEARTDLIYPTWRIIPALAARLKRAPNALGCGGSGNWLTKWARNSSEENCRTLLAKYSNRHNA